MDEKEILQGKTLQEVINKYYPLLTEARKRFFFILSVFAIGCFAGFVFYEPIIGFIIRALSLDGINIVFTSPFQFLNLAFTCGFIVGIVFCFPLIISQLVSFLRPALKQKEFKILKLLLPFSLILFLVGFGFGAVIMKWQIQIFLGQSVNLGIGNILDISNLLTVVLLTSAVMGIGFQFPIALLALMRFKILKYSKVASSRKWIYLGAFIFTLFLPIDSIVADVILTLPLVILFEVTLLLYNNVKKGGEQ